MDLFSFASTVVLVTASGALAPGPLFFATISHGVKSGARSGLIFSMAHSLVEFTVIMLLAFGLLPFAGHPLVEAIFGVAGGIVLLVFGAMQIRDSFKLELSKTEPQGMTSRSLLLVGLTFTGLNPFFILWWPTVGANLILLSLEFGSLAGVVFMFICHVWMDIVWLTSVAHFAGMGANVAGLKFYRILLAIFGAVLIYFGFAFITGSLR